MKTCPKCNITHECNGTFCSRKCANSRVFSPETNEKKRQASIQYYLQMTTAEQTAEFARRRSRYDYASQQQSAKQTKINKTLGTPYELLSRGAVRKKLFHECNNTCEWCGLKDSWNGLPISLEMDHIDGNNTNNIRSNLRVLCPNCHSQTHTFRARNIKSSKTVDIDQLTEMLIIHKFATPALRALGFNNSPAKMRLANSILATLRVDNKI